MVAPFDTEQSATAPAGMSIVAQSPPATTEDGDVRVAMAPSAIEPRPASSKAFRKSPGMRLIAIIFARLLAFVSGGTCIALWGFRPKTVSLCMLFVCAQLAGATAAVMASASSARCVPEHVIVVISSPGECPNPTHRVRYKSCKYNPVTG